MLSSLDFYFFYNIEIMNLKHLVNVIHTKILRYTKEHISFTDLTKTCTFLTEKKPMFY